MFIFKEFLIYWLYGNQFSWKFLKSKIYFSKGSSTQKSTNLIELDCSHWRCFISLKWYFNHSFQLPNFLSPWTSLLNFIFIFSQLFQLLLNVIDIIHFSVLSRSKVLQKFFIVVIGGWFLRMMNMSYTASPLWTHLLLDLLPRWGILDFDFIVYCLLGVVVLLWNYLRLVRSTNCWHWCLLCCVCWLLVLRCLFEF